MEKLCFKVQQVEGPLDLILQLLQKHKLNIYDIEISALLRQYLAAIEGMREARLDVASEFLEMASRLVNIKTAMLLPRREEDEDPRRELTGALIEYRACKEAAAALRERMTERWVRAPEKIEADPAYAYMHAPLELLRAYFTAMGRGRRRLPPPREVFSPLVSRRIVPVSERITFVMARLYGRGRVRLEELFLPGEGRPEWVATFLAVLELIRDGRAALGEGGVLTPRREAPGGLRHAL